MMLLSNPRFARSETKAERYALPDSAIGSGYGDVQDLLGDLRTYGSSPLSPSALYPLIPLGVLLILEPTIHDLEYPERWKEIPNPGSRRMSGRHELDFTDGDLVRTTSRS